jgi:sirohydrochlorin cobaltochelatase
VLGFEADIGVAQESHHHHVEGKGIQAPGSTIEDCALCDDFCTGACRVSHSHSHDHGHHPYPHADHPLGPRSAVGGRSGKGD